MSPSLNITEIYVSIQGESSYAGRPCAFVRLSECPLRCRWCDTVYSFKKGDALDLETILTQVDAFGVDLVEITGGEPLVQEGVYPLMEAFLAKGYAVLLETSGAFAIDRVPKDVVKIVDIKCPGSGMSDRNHWDNFRWLAPHDEIKLVVASREDFDWGVQKVRDYDLERWPVLFSAAYGLVKPQDLVAWLLESKLKARLNLQWHKYIWSPRTKGV